MNQKNLLGRIYSADSVNKILERFDYITSKLRCFLGGGEEEWNMIFGVNTMTHNVNRLWVDDDVLWAEIEIFDTPSGLKLIENLENFVFRASIIGEVLESGEVIVDELPRIYFVDKSLDTFKGML